MTKHPDARRPTPGRRWRAAALLTLPVLAAMLVTAPARASAGLGADRETGNLPSTTEAGVTNDTPYLTTEGPDGTGDQSSEQIELQSL